MCFSFFLSSFACPSVFLVVFIMHANTLKYDVHGSEGEERECVNDTGHLPFVSSSVFFFVSSVFCLRFGLFLLSLKKKKRLYILF